MTAQSTKKCEYLFTKFEMTLVLNGPPLSSCSCHVPGCLWWRAGVEALASEEHQHYSL